MFKYKSGIITFYLNGTEVKSINIPGQLEEPFDAYMEIGPRGALTGLDYIQLDEVHIYSAALSDRDIKKLAWVDTNVSTPDASNPSNFNVPSQLSSLPQEYTDLSEFSENETRIRRLGEHLFTSPILLANLDKSCASCHKPTSSFADADDVQFSPGADRNTPALVNLLFGNQFFLDGRVDSLEEQVLHLSLIHI